MWLQQINVLLLSVLFLFPANGWAAIAIVAHTAKVSVAGAGFTTSAINNTGANFLICAVSRYSLNAVPTLSDSSSNTWTQLTEYTNATGSTALSLYYVANATVSASQTFTITNGASNAFAGLACASFSGVATTTPFDVQNGANSGASVVTTQQPGSVTPTVNGELLITGIGSNGDQATGGTIDSSFTIADTLAGSNGNAEGIGLAYFVQPTAAAVNPTWSWTNGQNAVADIASFKAPAGGGSTVRNLMLMGVGQ